MSAKPSGLFEAITFREIVQSAQADEERRRARRTWGQWRLLTATWELALEQAPGRYRYLIDLERCDTSAAMLDWIFQVRIKRWATSVILGDLVLALRDIFDPQARLCSWASSKGGPGKTLDASKFLRRRYGTEIAP